MRVSPAQPGRVSRCALALLLALGVSSALAPWDPTHAQAQPLQAQATAEVQAQAQGALEDWRRDEAATHALVTNDIPRAYAQAQQLLAHLPINATAADRVAVLNVLARAEIYLAKPKEATAHARQAIDLAKSDGNVVGEIEGQLNIATSFINGSMSLDTLEAATTRAIALLDNVDRPDLLGEALLQASLTYLRAGQFDESVTAAIQSLQIAQRNNNPLALVYAEQSLTMALVQSGRESEALQHALKLPELARHTGSKLLEAQATFGLGAQYQLNGNIPAAEPLLRDSLQQFRAIGAIYIQGQVMVSLANAYRAEGKTDQALSTLNDADALDASYSNRLGLLSVLNSRSDLELSLGRRSAALADAKRAYDLAGAMDLLRFRSESARRMAAMVAAGGDMPRAYSYSVEAASLADQAARERANARLAEVTQQYDSESRKREVADLVHRNELQTAELKGHALLQRWLWTVLAGVIVTLVGTAYFLQRLRQSHRALEQTFAELQRSRDHIEERKAVEAARETALLEAERLARMRSEFLAQMSHELRTPLNGILGFAQLLLGDQQLSASQARGLAIIQQSGQHLLALINDILDLARIDAGKLELNITTIPLPSLLATVADIIRVKADEKKLHFNYQLVPLPPAVRGDDLRLRQVLLNLLSNAVKFTDHGHVSLAVATLGNGDKPTPRGNTRLRFEVRDTGIGMSPSQLSRLFQPFEQMAESRRREGGAGLGLAISRQLVHLMGGELEVRSEAGTGTVFAFELALPVTATDEDAGVSTQVGSVKGYEGRRRSILVADDVEFNRAMLVDTLNLLGFELSEVANGLEALERVRGRYPDLILMDVAMPLMDGLEATRRMRQMPGLTHVPIVITSASATPDINAASRAAGANEFMSKPIDRQTLLRVLGRLLDLRWIGADVPPPELAPARSTPPNPAPSGTSVNLVVPSREEMLVLLGLARIGNMRDIREHADHLSSLNPAYAAFCNRLSDLAATYESRAIVALIGSHFSE
jgi:signal transduction histidine kinase/DNA-binding NarL/FixJ family response regulator